MARSKAIFNGGQDCAERKVTKCHVSREGQNPNDVSYCGFNSQKQKSPQRRTFIGGGKDSAEENPNR